MHHIRGKDIAPDALVPLCPQCHEREHRGMLLYANRAAVLFFDWLDEQQAAGRYIPWQARMKKLDELGYKPVPEQDKPIFLGKRWYPQ